MDYDESKSCLIFQPLFNFAKIFTSTIDKSFRWKLKRLSDESVTNPAAPGKGLPPRLNYITNAKIQVTFIGSSLKQYKASFTHGNIVNVSLIYELDIWSYDLSNDLTQKDCLFVAVKLTMNVYYAKYSYFGYGIVSILNQLFLILNLD